MQASDPDADMRELAALDLESSEEKLAALRNQLRDLLLPEDKHDQLGAMLEIKAGIGGKEAASIVGLLARMYTRYSQAHSWKAVMLDSSRVEADTYKDVLLEVKGRGAYGALKRESGVHRVQRFPVNDPSRIHTSTAAVFVSFFCLPPTAAYFSNRRFPSWRKTSRMQLVY